MHANRLAGEKSPYLLQHAHNPVDWYPWGAEAMEKARAEDKPVFLSVGYSTCHWCHVMERESFENERIAGILNRDFVPVKVDREERPDVDRIYMLFVQSTAGGGGWPMSVWLTPELKPFFGGTYFPPDERYGRPGFAAILEQIAEGWKHSRAAILQSSEAVLEQLKNYSGAPPVLKYADRTALESGFQAFRRGFDPALGGFGDAPKFPRPSTHNFLLREYARTGNREALDMVLATLRAMARGGIHDHLGGGFHRYSVDARWFTPHFEKMLYDQAQLAISYLEAFQAAGGDYLARVARGILDYVLRDMTASEGGFYSAEDADSADDPSEPHVKSEGAFYLWSWDEIEALVPPQVFAWFCYRYGLEPQGNVREDPQGEFHGKNILFEAHTVEETARHFAVASSDVAAALGSARAALLAMRSLRARPHLDDKILTGWNGLMISAFALAAQVLEEPRYLAAARNAADFILARLYDPAAGTLLRRYRQGEAAVAGFLDDYAFFAQSLLDLYETVFDPRYLDLALLLTEKQLALFQDSERGAFFSTVQGDPSLLLRMKDDHDSAEPSGNSVAILNLLRLSEMTGREWFRDVADKALSAFAERLTVTPSSLPQMLVALDFRLSKPTQITFAGKRDAPELQELLRALRQRFVPHKVVLWRAGETGGKAAAYVCEDFTCRPSVIGVTEFSKLLDSVA